MHQYKDIFHLLILIQCPPLILAPLVNMSKGGCENKLHCLSFLSFIPKIHKIPTYHWSKTIENGGKSHCVRNTFSSSCGPQLLAPNYCNVLFPAQQLCVFSYNAWRVWRTHDKRSETIPSYRISLDPSDSQLHVGASPLQFTSLIFYRVQVRGREWP